MNDAVGRDPEGPHFGKWYTRVIGVFFLLVAFSLFRDVASFGFRPETFHKIFHVILGFVVVWLGWFSPAWWKVFPWVNGAFFLYVGAVGWLFPDFAGLDAFNRLDTILHSIVGVSGLAVGVLDSRRPAEKTQ